MKTLPLILNDARSANSTHKLHCLLRNKEDTSKPVEVLIYDVIGKDWDGSGFDAKDFVENLKGLDENRELCIRVNSRGGIVDEGIAIYNRLKEWKGKTVAIVDGSAASIASVLIMGADEVHMPTSAEILIHEAHAFAMGDAEDMRELADRLDNASDRIANIYAVKSGRSKEEMRGYMRKTSVFNGAQAKELGLADVLTDQVPLYNFTPQEISRFRVDAGQKPKPEADAKQGADSKSKDQMRDQIIALLNKLGIKFENTATDAQLLNLLGTQAEAAKAQLPTTPENKDKTQEDPTIKALRDALSTITNRMETERKARITAEIDRLIDNNQVPGAMRDKAIARAMADETILDEYRANPSVPPGAEPLNAIPEITGEDPREIEKAVLKNFGGKTILTPQQAQERGRLRAHIISKNWNRIFPVMNTNTVSSDLKRTVILQQMIRAFAIKILPLSAFATQFNGIRLEGTDKVALPYFPLITTTATDFVAGNGYNTFTNSNSDAKTITVDKRKYLGLQWTSSELARQPFMDMGMAATLIADQLGLDVVNDIMSIIVAATYTNTPYPQPASAFDSDDVMTLKGAADLANWPSAGRSLVLNSAYDVNLLKDPSVKNVYAFGDNSPIREGRIVRIGGFDYFPDARVPDNSQSLQGFIAFKSALLAAFSPVNPTPEVMQQLTRYEVVVEPTTGAQFEYRMWGDPDMDRTSEIVESNYGRTAGEVTALTRITS